MKRTLCILCLLSVFGIMAQNNRSTNPKIGIKELFLQLPDSVFKKDSYLRGDDRKKLFTTANQESDDEVSRPYIDEYDPQKGYLLISYTFFNGLRYQIWSLNLKDGRKLVVVNENDGKGHIHFFLDEKGVLKKALTHVPEIHSVQVDDFFETSHLNTTEKEALQYLLSRNKIVFEYELLYQKRVIRMSIFSIGFDTDLPVMIDQDKLKYKQVLFRWVNDKWIKEVQKWGNDRWVKEV